MMELRRQAGWARSRPSLHHFHTREGREVDVIVEGPGGRIAGMKAKFSATPTGRDFARLRYLRAKTRDRFAAGVVLYPGREPLPFGDDLWATPLSSVWEG